MSVKLLTEHHLELLSLKGGCTGSSESTLVKMPHCLKSHVAAQICLCRKQIDHFLQNDAYWDKNIPCCKCKNIYFPTDTKYNAFNVYCRELAPGTVSLTGDRAQGDDGKH